MLLNPREFYLVENIRITLQAMMHDKHPRWSAEIVEEHDKVIGITKDYESAEDALAFAQNLLRDIIDQREEEAKQKKLDQMTDDERAEEAAIQRADWLHDCRVDEQIAANRERNQP